MPARRIETPLAHGVVHKLVLATSTYQSRCTSAHAPLKGVDSREEFNSSSSSALGEQFWWLCVVPFLDPENASLRVGESAHAAYSGPWFSAKSQWYPIRAPLPSFSSASSSMHGLFAHWREGDLTRPITWVQTLQRNISLEPLHLRVVTEGTWQDAWWVALWRDAFWLTWFFDDSSMCASWRPWFFDGFSESARRVPRLFNGCSEKCP